MNFFKIPFAVMALLNNLEAVKVEQASHSEFTPEANPAGPAPGQVYDLSEWSLHTPEFKYNDGRVKCLSKGFQWNSGKRYLTDHWRMNPENDGIRMSVPLYGARTSTSTANPRMELRETYEWTLP